jgi:RNA polymerase subunit RPABC4/transcription elongation factor Spt4
MLTPSNTECPYYYEDFHRGHSTQECRLIARNPRSEAWRPGLCARCPVPAILRANACPNMALQAQVARRWLGLVRRVEVYAVCTAQQVEVKDPYVGCGHCHPQTATIFDAPVAEEN